MEHIHRGQTRLAFLEHIHRGQTRLAFMEHIVQYSVHVNQLHVMMQTKDIETLLLYSVYIHKLL
jgi:hypothetical protein